MTRDDLAREIADRACARQIAIARATWLAHKRASLARRRERIPTPRQTRSSATASKAARTFLRMSIAWSLDQIDHAARTMTPGKQRLLARRIARKVARLHAQRMTA